MNVHALNLAQVSMFNLVVNNDRSAFLTKTVKAYQDPTCFQTAEVEDTMPDRVFGAAVMLKVQINADTMVRKIGMITKDGFAIILHEVSEEEGHGTTVVESYQNFLKQFQEPKAAFTAGIRIQVSKDLVRRLKAPVEGLVKKFMGLEAFMTGRLSKFKEDGEFSEKLTGAFQQSETKDCYQFAIDGEAVETFVLFAIDMYDVLAKKAMAFYTLMDFTGLKASAKELEAKLNARNNSLK